MSDQVDSRTEAPAVCPECGGDPACAAAPTTNADPSVETWPDLESLKESERARDRGEAILSETETALLVSALRDEVLVKLPALKPETYPFDEDGTARLLVDLILGYVLNVPELGGVHAYDFAAGTWKRCDIIAALIRFLADQLYRLRMPADPDEVKRRAKHVARLLTAQGVRAIEYLALRDPRIVAKPDVFDRRPDIVVFKDKIVELETGLVREHRPSDLATLSVNGYYRPEATCPTFEKVVNDALEGRTDDILFLQKWAGYSISGYTEEQAALIAEGPGNNAKGTIFNAIFHAYGSYAKGIPITTLMQQRERTATNDLASLRAVRYGLAGEAERGQRWDESLFKTLTGEDPVTARLLYHEFFTYIPHFKITLYTNYLPRVVGTDVGFWRRPRVLPFHWQVPEEKKDKRLAEKLRAEADGILQWAIEGFTLWRAEGLGSTSSMVEALDKYRKESDGLADFVDDLCVRDPEFRTRTLDLFNHYRSYCARVGQDPMSFPSFRRAMQERGFAAIHTDIGSVFLRIAPRAFQETDYDDNVPF